MAIKDLSHNFITSRLKDNIHISKNDVVKIIYFRDAIKKEYPHYKKELGDKARSYEAYADIVLKRHSHTILNQSLDFQKNYFKNPTYIDKLLKDTLKAEEAKTNPEHTFTREEYIDPIILQFENLIDRRYKNLLAINPKDFANAEQTIYSLAKRFFEQIISGLTLLEREAYNDSFIIWRSLLETTTTLLILSKHNELIGMFNERHDNALRRINIINSNKQIQIEKSREAEAHLGQKNVPWFTRERFGWAGQVIKNKEFNLKSLLDVVNIASLHSHYTFASLFVHEYLITPTKLKMDIDFQKYLLTLYFRLYELIRVLISDTFTHDLDDGKKLEEGIRSEVKNFATRFKDFSLRIENA